MAVKLVSESGAELTLNPSFRVEGLPLERDVPAVVLDGAESRHTLAGLVRTRPREVAISGHWWGSREEADAARRQLLRLAARRERVRIFTEASDDTGIYGAGARYLTARLRGDGISFVEGTGQRVIAARLVFVAHDPYWYSVTERFYEARLTASGEQFSVNNEGNAPCYAVLWIHGASPGGVPLRNPTVENTTAGVTMAFTGELADGQALLAFGEPLHPAARSGAAVRPWYLLQGGLMLRQSWGLDESLLVDASGSMGPAWVLRAFPLLPGGNTLEFRDDASGGHQATISIVWRPRWR